MHRALIHVLVGLIALLAEPGYFFFVARGRSVGHKTLRQPKQMALFFGRINLQSSRFESQKMLLNVKKCYPIPSSSAKSLGASVFFFFSFFLFCQLSTFHDLFLFNWIQWEFHNRLKAASFANGWVIRRRRRAHKRSRSWRVVMLMPRPEDARRICESSGIGSKWSNFQGPGPWEEKNFHPLSWASAWRPEDQNETRNNQEPAKKNHPQVMYTAFWSPFWLVYNMYHV